MTTPARQREADRATTAFQLALTTIGVETVTDALVLWDDVPASDRQAKVNEWMDSAVKLVMSRRTLSVQIARAYYRLIRALRTGRTVADPNTPEPQYVTLQKLRHEFAVLAEPRLSERYKAHLAAQPAPNPSRNRSEPQQASVLSESHDDDLDRILVDEINGLKEREAADAAAAEDELRIQIEQLGLKNRQKLEDSIDTSAPADEVDKQRREPHDRAGLRQAAASERIAMNGARGTVWNHHELDSECIGWIRVSTTGTPCGWCAMLISRGPVYKSKRSAEYVDGDKYHDNCHCEAVPVFSDDEYETSPSYALNREYQKLWPQVTRGHSGEDALSVWRRYFRNQQRAQAARPTTNVQEA